MNLLRSFSWERTSKFSISKGNDIIIVPFNPSFHSLQSKKAKAEMSIIFCNILPRRSLNMPGMSGHELLTHIKSSVLNRDIRVVILSGLSGTSDRIKCLEAGADDFVTKPFNPKELELRILKHIRQFSEA